ncbi:MAG: hypothetical protein SF182_19065 [Deltaproteobacteria bacterium]|nr:hypothetical protein [Deltaproteobacteria bacterium]
MGVRAAQAVDPGGESAAGTGDGRLFVSDVASPAELLQRAQARLLASGAAPAVATHQGDGAFDLASDAGLLGGWYYAETFSGEPTRWTQRRFQFSAEVGAATHLAIEALLPPESGFAELRARLWVDDRAGEAFRIRPGWNRVHVPLPSGLHGPAHFLVDVGGAWCPLTQSLSEDQRELAVCIRRLALVRFDLESTLELPAPALAPDPPARHALDAAPSDGLGVRANARPRRRLEWLRTIDQIPDLQERAVAVQARLDALQARCAEAEARLAALQGQAQQMTQAIAQLTRALDARFAALEAAQRELRDDVNQVCPIPLPEP